MLSRTDVILGLEVGAGIWRLLITPRMLWAMPRKCFWCSQLHTALRGGWTWRWGSTWLRSLQRELEERPCWVHMRHTRNIIQIFITAAGNLEEPDNSKMPCASAHLYPCAQHIFCLCQEQNSLSARQHSWHKCTSGSELQLFCAPKPHHTHWNPLSTTRAQLGGQEKVD